MATVYHSQDLDTDAYPHAGRGVAWIVAVAACLGFWGLFVSIAWRTL